MLIATANDDNHKHNEENVDVCHSNDRCRSITSHVNDIYFIHRFGSLFSPQCPTVRQTSQYKVNFNILWSKAGSEIEIHNNMQLIVGLVRCSVDVWMWNNIQWICATTVSTTIWKWSHASFNDFIVIKLLVGQLRWWYLCRATHQFPSLYIYTPPSHPFPCESLCISLAVYKMNFISNLL